jgi:hypothetical protein
MAEVSGSILGNMPSPISGVLNLKDAIHFKRALDLVGAVACFQGFI